MFKYMKFPASIWGVRGRVRVFSCVILFCPYVQGNALGKDGDNFDDVGSGFEAAPAELYPEEQAQSVINPIKSPNLGSTTPLYEKAYVVDFALGQGESRGYISSRYANENFGSKFLRGRKYRLRLAVVADRKQDSAGMYYFSIHRHELESKLSYELSELKISTRLSSYQVGYQHLWQVSSLPNLLAGAELDMGVSLEDVELSSLHGSIRHTRLRPNIGAGLVSSLFLTDSINLSLSVRSSSHTKLALLLGGGYAF